MRLDPLLDSFYVLGSLWGGLTGPQVCPSTPPLLPRTMYEIVRPLAPAPVTAFVDVNVIPMDTERVLPNHTVLVEGGRITALGPTSQVKVPAGAVRIDGRGKYLIPGLGDMHVHEYSDLGLLEEPQNNGMLQRKHEERFRLIAMGVTAVRTLSEYGGPSVVKLQEVRKRLASGEVVSPRLYMSRSFAIKQGWLGPAIPAESLGAYVAATKAAGYDHIGLRDEVESPGDQVFIDSLAAAARRAGLPISEHAHRHSLAAILAIGRSGGSIEHLTTFIRAAGYQQPAHPGEKDDALKAFLPKAREVAAAMQRAGVWINPSLDCQHTLGATSIKGLPEITKVLHDAGVKLLLAGDESSVHKELAAMVRMAGLTPYQALLTGTRNVAEYMRRTDDLGTVAVGKFADLVVLYGNPLADIKHIWEPAGVMLEGRWLDRAALDQGVLTSSRAHPLDRIRAEIPSRMNYVSRPRASALTDEQLAYHKKYETPLQTTKTLADSLKKTPPSEKATYERLARRLAEEFGALRPLLPLPPEQQAVVMTFDPHVRFDAAVRVWLRELARQGFQVTVPGLSMAP